MIIVCDRPRQLGNSLFVFAHLLAFAKENNLRLAHLSFAEFARYFESTKDDLYCRFPLKKSSFTHSFLRRILYRGFFVTERVLYRLKIKTPFVKCFRIEEEDDFNTSLNRQFVQSATTTPVTIFQGWGFRDNEAFIKHADFIRSFFMPVPVHQHPVNNLIENSRKNGEMLVGIHIRHGDYQKYLGGKYFYSIEKYKSKMKEVQRIFPGKKIKFLICSNEKLKESDFREFNFVFGTHHFIEDLYAFAKCDYLLGSPSTYTMWASFYGKVPLCILEDINAPVNLADFKVISV